MHNAGRLANGGDTAFRDAGFSTAAVPNNRDQ